MLNTIRICNQCGTLVTIKKKKGIYKCGWCGSVQNTCLQEESERLRAEGLKER